ncbi:sirohydrochlorin cobaltochelatase [Vibrio sp. MACH09]|uniref:sirohydrochlorin cobaltochelatase n=1 Tax=Vibrio sp. MACH09 TaxID=3025122 RepID=UPI00295EFAB5|nr:sirohydrochlorin cobaltochelatase [Vibrio sp. MACH09]
MNLVIVKKRLMALLSVSALCLLSSPTIASDSMNKANDEKSAIVIAAFGTTYNTAVDSLIAIQNTIQQAYPNTPVRFAFTSNIIRKKWHRRQNDTQYKEDHPEVPDSFYHVKNVLGTMADFQNEGYKNIVVQTTLLTHGEEYTDLVAYVDALASIQTIKEKFKPFQKIALGRPLMGTWGKQYEYSKDLDKLAEALADDVELAKRNKAALVYMGHGNDYLSTGLYYELEDKLNQMYPEVKSYVGLVEGHPNFDALSSKIKQDGSKKVMIKPLMVVAGDHASNDMAGDEDDSWKVMLTKQGIDVTPVLVGLGSSEKIQQIYLQHLKDAANDAGITLK